MTHHDHTLSPDSLMGSKAWVARRLGRSPDWLTTNLHRLVQDGFPQQDPLLRLWIKADVDAWIEKRRRVKAPEGVIQAAEPEIEEGAL